QRRLSLHTRVSGYVLWYQIRFQHEATDQVGEPQHDDDAEQHAHIHQKRPTAIDLTQFLYHCLALSFHPAVIADQVDLDQSMYGTDRADFCCNTTRARRGGFIGESPVPVHDR
ncbi:hypothetical protein, partial [Komagataeibacter europaeus]|uniref:hypothetical protein n=1 Tax=Komagataeibacter europaeus TaxID=33995 RepID=UPI00222FC69B